MSEVIVRMEKFPTKCFDCKMWSICKAFNKAMVVDQDWSASRLFHKTENGFTKPVDCPIIGVLPEKHGRLVDADSCSSVLRKLENEAKTNTEKLCYAYAARMFEEAFTIIAAERKDNE